MLFYDQNKKTATLKYKTLKHKRMGVTSIGTLILAVALLFQIPTVGLGRVANLEPQPSQAKDVAYLDTLLALASPGQTQLRIDDEVFELSRLRAYRNELASDMLYPHSASKFPYRKWPSGRVPYTFDSSISLEQRDLFQRAARDWEVAANVNFVPISLPTSEQNYVRVIFEASGFSESNVGMIDGSGSQDIIFSNGANEMTMCHELGHLLGLIHEHQRSDRDSFITVHMENIDPTACPNQCPQMAFDIIPSTLNGPYDFASVMHYPLYAYGNGDPPIELKVPFSGPIGNVQRLSDLDMSGMALMYGAPHSFTVVPYEPIGLTVIPGNAQVSLVWTQSAGATAYNVKRSTTIGTGYTVVGANVIGTSYLDTGLTNTITYHYAISSVNAVGESNNSIDIGVTPETLFAPDNIVTNTQDSGIGSLRNALIFANANPGTTIQFHIPTTDPQFNGHTFTIRPGSPLPTITASRTFVDGTTQASFLNDTTTTGPLIDINGAIAGRFTIGITITADHCEVKDVTVNGFSGAGIAITGAAATYNLIDRCYIGTDSTGVSAVPNGDINAQGGVAILADAQNNVVGGVGGQNIISGNVPVGVLIEGTLTSGNVITGNLIGLDKSGQFAIPNGYIGGVLVFEGPLNRIGGIIPGERNCISGNWTTSVNSNGDTVTGGSGVMISADSTEIIGNYLGTNATGTAAVPNGDSGIDIENGVNTIIGGTTESAGNLISGNRGDGIIGYCSDTTVQGNLIGTDVSGLHALGNGVDGVFFIQHAQNNVIGGLKPGAGNRIAFNHGSGIGIQDEIILPIASTAFHSVGNPIRQNSITGNSILGISFSNANIDYRLPVLNTPGGPHVGPNDLQNYPVISSVVQNGSTTVISGLLNSTPLHSFDIDMFGNTSANPSGYGEGDLYLGTVNVQTDASGNSAFSYSCYCTSPIFTSTATDTTTNDTSQFSKAFPVLTPINAHIFPQGLQFVAVPFAFKRASTADLLSDPSPKVAVWQPQTMQYALSPAFPADAFRIGQGYWIRLSQPTSLNQVGVITDMSKPFDIPLNIGWNMVGDPFADSASASQLMVTNSTGAPESFSAAIADHLVSPLYSFDSIGNRYIVVAPDAEIEPWIGYWIRAFEKTTLMVNPH